MNQNRSTPASTFSDFAVRLRQFMAETLASGPSRPEKTHDRFNALALELFGLQFTHNAAYRRLCEARAVHPAAILHWSDIPAVPTVAFKELELTSLPAAERTAVFHSSGTTGRHPSRHFHGEASMALYEESLLAWFQRCLDETHETGEDAVAVSRLSAGVDFLFLTPPLSEAPRSSLVHMFETVRRQFGSAASGVCGTVEADGGWSLDSARVETVLESSVRRRRPLFVLGTAFNYVHLLERFSRSGIAFELPPGSRALETGGYKGRSRALSKEELHALISERLGVSPGRIIREYGMSELSSQAYDTPGGPPRASRLAPRPFRFPPWARVRIVSPETGREVAEGETGRVRIFDLANVWSVLAVQTEDLGIRRRDGFELIGRAAAAEPRGCSLMAVGNE